MKEFYKSFEDFHLNEGKKIWQQTDFDYNFHNQKGMVILSKDNKSVWNLSTNEWDMVLYKNLWDESGKGINKDISSDYNLNLQFSKTDLGSLIETLDEKTVKKLNAKSPRLENIQITEESSKTAKIEIV